MRVLVVEDDGTLGEEVTDGLRAVGYDVDLATSSRDADLHLAFGDYDCLLVDDRLLGTDAADPVGGAAWLRAGQAAGKDTPVLVLVTPPGAVGDDIADDRLVMPFTLAEVAAKVRVLCRRDEAMNPIVRAADLELDPDRRRVRRAGVPLMLDTQEFAVLELLATRAPEVVSREDIVERCRNWPGESPSVESRSVESRSTVVDAVIGSLRRKLGPPILIGTAGEVGYRITGGTSAGTY